MSKLKGSLLVVAGYTGMQQTNDMESKFVQEGNFWYLTGVEFPDWWLIVDSKRGKSWLVEPDIDEMHRLFTESLDQQAARDISGIAEILTRDQALSMLRTAAKTRQLVYTIGTPPYHEHFGFSLNPAPHDMRQMLERLFAKVDDFRLEMARIRAIKQPIELAMMQSAIDVTVKALAEVKANIATYHYEYQIEADLTHTFRYNGGQGHAFDPIIASGANATVAHYFTNHTKLKKGSFVMLDVGAKTSGYSADITRTYAYGKPTKRMQAVHDAVREAQQAIIESLKPGLSLEAYQQHVDTTVKEAMVRLNIMRSLDDEQGYHRHMPHAVSHGLGVDVHDALGRPRELQPGMVITVEPGIYLGDEGIGVRIEDDILITETGYRNLSAKLPTNF
jgi:Xaa-Pro aminopeptidase